MTIASACGGVGRDGQAVLGEQAEHPLAVDEVLRAAEADEGDGFDVLAFLGMASGLMQAILSRAGNVIDCREISNSRLRGSIRQQL